MNSSDEILRSEDDWNNQWTKWFTRYSKGNPRLGKWLSSLYSLSGATILEIGAGSGRESRFLAAIAKSVTCVDFAPEAVNLLSNSNPPPNMKALVADAAKLPFPERAFDVSFHKGVWVLFPEDHKLELLLKEQLRVTNGTVLAIVQNARNSKQVREARIKSTSDPLFRIRFFDPAELKALGSRVVDELGIAASVRVLKYGNPSMSKLLTPLGAVGDWIAAKVYRFLPWTYVECAVLEIVQKRI
jgi:SAM-dependent methyltransferase